ncbi:MAG: DUF192 domain-containing protein [Caldimonas sp.]
MNDRWMRRVVAALALGAASVAAAQQGPQALPQVKLTAGIHVINAEVATTPQQREIGLMHRTAMAANDGMLFVFERPGRQCFWMRNTLIPLSIAFLADDGSVVNVEDMAPQTLDGHCSAKPVRYVLEMNKGWFAKRGVKPGAKLRGAPFAQ